MSLEGTNGTKRVDWDYARDLVTISYDPRVAKPGVYVAAMAKLGYDAKQAATPAPKTKRSTLPAPFRVPADAPRFFVEAIERARAANRPMVIDFWAEWCAACLRLKHETLEHPDVAKALRAVEMIYVDLDKYPALGDAFNVVAIPDVIFVAGSGSIVDRIQNFEPPETFVARMRKIFGQVSRRDSIHE